MKSNTQNKKIEAITEKTLVVGIDVGSEMHYARAFDHRGIEYSKKHMRRIRLSPEWNLQVTIGSISESSFRTAA